MVKSSILGEGFTIRNDVEYVAAAEDYNHIMKNWLRAIEWGKHNPSKEREKFYYQVAIHCAKKFGGIRNTAPILDPKKVMKLAEQLKVLEAI